MLIKPLLNKVARFKSFVYGATQVMLVHGAETLVIDIKPRSNSKPAYPECGNRGATHDKQPVCLFEYVPIWTFKAYLRYAPRRVSCPRHGVKVEALPLGYGKERMTFSYQVYLARWGKRLPWKETADIFETNWDTVFRAVNFVVDYGLAHRSFDGVTEIGVDEISAFKGHKYLTMVYQINDGAKRRLWRDRSVELKRCCASSMSLAKGVASSSSSSAATCGHRISRLSPKRRPTP